MMNCNNVTQEVNFYHKDICNLNEHYRLRPVSSYMTDETYIFRKMPDLPYAYACLNEPNAFTRLIRENEANDLIVGEGLIKTYPAKKALAVFKRFCKDNLPHELLDLKMSDTELVKMHNERIIDLFDDSFDDNDIIDKIWFQFPFYDKDEGKLSEFIKKLNDVMFVCGYSYASSHRYCVAVQPFADTITLVSLLFEAKYFEEKFVWSENLYHVTTFSRIDKIRKRGLVPKNQSIRFDYPDRVYLFNNADRQTIFDYICVKAPITEADKAVILKINSDNLRKDIAFTSGKMKFFVDHMFEQSLPVKANAIFTYDVIRPSLIDDEMLVVDVVDSRVISVKTEKFK